MSPPEKGNPLATSPDDPNGESESDSSEVALDSSAMMLDGESDTASVAGGGSSGEPPADPEEAEIDGKRMTLLEHLSELRVRLRNAAIIFTVSMLGSFFFVARFFEILTRPVRRGMIKAGFDANFAIKSVTEPFWVYMKLAIVAGILIASPFIFWELWKFVAPGLYRKERRLATGVTGTTALCFIGGALFGYLVLCEPAAYYMMSLLRVEDLKTPVEFGIKPQLMMDEVGDFLMLMLAGCGAAFELPVVVALLGALGIVSSRALWKFNKYALVLATVLGAVLTPSTDPFTQCLLAGPLFGLYQVSIVVVWLIERGRKRKEAELEKEYESSSSSGPDDDPST
jgi:sec-independent protein translocase protein TatC